MGRTDKSALTFPKAEMVNIFRSEGPAPALPPADSLAATAPARALAAPGRQFSKRPGPKAKNEESDVWRFEENMRIVKAPVREPPAMKEEQQAKPVNLRRQYPVFKNMESTAFWKNAYGGSQQQIPMESRPRADVSADDLDARQARTQHVAEMAEASQKRFREAEVVRWDGMRSGWDVGATKVVQAKKPDSIRPTRSIPYDPIHLQPLKNKDGEEYAQRLTQAMDRVATRARNLYLKNNSHDPIRGIDVRPPSPDASTDDPSKTRTRWSTTPIGVVPAGRVTDGHVSSAADTYRRHY